MSDNFDVVVIGAGISGLRAAWLLVQAGRRVVVVEARERVGGRTKSVKTPASDAKSLSDEEGYDKGAGWVSPAHTRWLALARELGVSTFPQSINGTGVVLLKSASSPITLKNIPLLGGLIPMLSVVDLLVFQVALMRLENMSRQLSLATPWTAARAGEWDSLSASQWLLRRVPRLKVRELLTTVLEGILLEPLEHVSFLWLLFYIRSAGGVRALSDEAQAMRVVEGSQELCLRMAERLKEASRLLSYESPLRLNCAVCRVDTSLETDNFVSVFVRDSQGTISQLSARYVIAAISPKLLQKIEFDRAIARSLQGKTWFGGTGVKWTMTYSKPFWKDTGHSGIVVESEYMPWVFDGSTRSGKTAALVGFLRTQPRMGEEGRGATATLSSRQATVVGLLERALGSQARTLALQYDELDWSVEEWSGNCVNGTPPGLLSQHGDCLFQPHDGRVYWAGTEAALRWNGYMEGAIEAGEQAADAVNSRLHELDGSSSRQSSKAFADVTLRLSLEEGGKPSVFRKVVGACERGLCLVLKRHAVVFALVVCFAVQSHPLLFPFVALGVWLATALNVFILGIV